MARDFGEKFHVQLADIGGAVRFDTAVLWVASLMRDPSSWVQAAVSGWAYPISREGITLLDQIDVLMRVHTKPGSFKPYPRPWPKVRAKVGAKKVRNAAEVMKILRPNR